jgi:hypothetical protein
MCDFTIPSGVAVLSLILAWLMRSLYASTTRNLASAGNFTLGAEPPQRQT